MTPQDQIYSVPTNLGLAKMAYAQANGLSVNITHMAIGDGNGALVNPDSTWPGLAREVHRAQLNQLYQHAQNPNWLVAELVLPPEVGGWTIREIALYDQAGDLIYIGNHAEQYKPIQSQGSDETKTIRMVILVSSTSTVTLKTDPTTVLATVDYVQRELAKLDYKQSVRYATKGNISLQGLGVQAGGDWSAALTAGDRILVRSQTAGKDNGIYVAAGGVWVRATDADLSVEVTAGLVVSVEQGATLADTIWQLITDNPIVVGTTALTFRDITDGFARLLSPVFAGNPTAPTPAQFDSSLKLATTEFVKRLGLEFSSFGSVSSSTALTSANIGGLISASSETPITITLPSTTGVAQGATVAVISAGTGAVTVAAAAGGDIVFTSNGQTGSIALGLGDSAEFIKLNGQWRLVGGSVMLRYSQVMSGDGFLTQAQFNNAQRLATTEFVQRALGCFSGSSTLSADTILTKADVGKIIRVASTGFTITLPLISTLVEGATITIQHSGTSATHTVVTQGADVIDPGSNTITSITLELGDTVILTRAGGNWSLVGGSAALAYIANPTLPQFDQSQRLANAAFVQRALGNYRRSMGIANGGTLLPSDAGSLVNLSVAVSAATLPLLSATPAGSAFTFIKTGAGAATLSTQGSDVMSSEGVSRSSIVIDQGESLTLIAAGAIWYAIGTAADKHSHGHQYIAGPGNSGALRLPCGRMFQWGTDTLALANANTWRTTSFVTAFGGAVESITYGISVDDATPAQASGNVRLSDVRIAGSFKWSRDNTGPANVRLFWSAVGPAPAL